MIVTPPVTTVIAQAAATSAPATDADAAVTARAKDWLHQIQTGKVDRSQLTDKMNAALTDTTLASVSAQLSPLGDPTSFTLSGKTTEDVYTVYVFKVVWPSVTLAETFAVDRSGKIAGLYLGKQ
ncbi:MAG: hypothetical protein JO190_00715 [Candidatus Eremiobacteraeota bacterium]|nr:hypothetical protein [Candidatus Eremiobacteraeota bacterium]MBV8498393.1 hypothetical protein [Candidatus Eremiobacteraeota bacterium]